MSASSGTESSSQGSSVSSVANKHGSAAFLEPEIRTRPRSGPAFVISN